MCIIVDTNCLSRVFEQTNSEHEDFAPVKGWIINGKGKIVWGGSKYRDELKKLPRYLQLFVELAKLNKVVSIPHADVDDAETWAAAQEAHVDFDDPHIVAIARVSGCVLICSRDARAYPFFKNGKFYINSGRIPKIYQATCNSDLLVDKNIAECCKPCAPTTKSLASEISAAIVKTKDKKVVKGKRHSK